MKLANFLRNSALEFGNVTFLSCRFTFFLVRHGWQVATIPPVHHQPTHTSLLPANTWHAGSPALNFVFRCSWSYETHVEANSLNFLLFLTACYQTMACRGAWWGCRGWWHTDARVRHHESDSRGSGGFGSRLCHNLSLDLTCVGGFSPSDWIVDLINDAHGTPCIHLQ